MNIRPLAITRAFTLFCTLLIALSNSKAFANEITNGSTDALVAEAWEALRKGDAVGLMRHALAPGTGDPTNFQLNNCSTQRNLSDEGREQARRFGDYLRANRIDNASIFSSEWCRCMETAHFLDFGEPQKLSTVNSFFQDRSTAQEQTKDLATTLENWITNDKQTRLIVTHQVNISALTGEYASSGDMVIVTVIDGELTVLAKIAAR